MQYFPPALEKLVEQFARLPGIGRKTAQRLAFFVLSLPEEDAAAFADAIVGAKAAIHCCPVCQNFSEGARVHQVPEDHRFIFSAHKAQGGLNGAGKAAAGDFHRGAPFHLGSIYPKSAFLRGRWIRI